MATTPAAETAASLMGVTLEMEPETEMEHGGGSVAPLPAGLTGSLCAHGDEPPAPTELTSSDKTRSATSSDSGTLARTRTQKRAAELVSGRSRRSTVSSSDSTEMAEMASEMTGDAVVKTTAASKNRRLFRAASQVAMISTAGFPTGKITQADDNGQVLETAKAVFQEYAKQTHRGFEMTEGCFKTMMPKLFGDVTDEDINEFWDEIEEAGT